MRTKTIFFTPIFITILVINLGAAAFRPLDEERVVRTALENNPGIEAYEKNKNAAESRAWKSFWPENPKIGMENMNGRNGLFSSGIKKLTISQKIPFPIRAVFEANAAIFRSHSAGYKYEAKKWKIIRDTRNTYYELYRLEKIIDITEETTELVRQFSSVASNKYAVNSAAHHDVLKANVEYARLKNELITLRQKRQITKAKLKSLLGKNTQILDNSRPEKPRLPLLNPGFGKIKEIISKAPVVKKAKADKNTRSAEKNAAYAGYIPDFNLKYKKHLNTGSNDYDIMFEISVPLWFFSNNQAQINTALAGYESAKSSHEDIYNRAQAEAKEHYEIMNSALRLIKLYENTLIPQAKAAFNSSRAAYTSNKTGFINLLDSERSLLNFRVEYQNKFKEYLSHFRMLEALLGTSLDKNKKEIKGGESK